MALSFIKKLCTLRKSVFLMSYGKSRHFSSPVMATESPFINVEQISDKIWKVMENDKYGETPFLYSILGVDKIVLIDTGVNSANYKTYLRTWPQFRSLPFLVINTHVHFDHVSGNHHFATSEKQASDCLDVCVWGGDKKFTLGYQDPKIDSALIHLMGPGIKLEDFKVTRWLQENDIIYLDDDKKDENEALHIMHLPGHTPDSIGIHYPAEKRVFVGDHVYTKSPLILYDSSPEVYKESVIKLKDYIIKEHGGLDGVQLSCAHADVNLSAKKLDELIQLLNDIASGKAVGKDASKWQKYAPFPVQGYTSESYLVLSK